MISYDLIKVKWRLRVQHKGTYLNETFITFWRVDLPGRVDHLGGVLESAAERPAAEPRAALRVAGPVPGEVNPVE